MTHYEGSVPETQRKTDWRDTAACREQKPEAWFPKPGNTDAVRAAKAACFACPVMLQCAQHALTKNEDDGVWGGLSEGQRTTIRKKYRLHQLENLATVRMAVEQALHAERNPVETLRDLWEKYTRPLPGGHIGWTGPAGSFSFRGLPVTPKQLAFMLDRGHKAVGIIRRAPECPVLDCVNPRHILDGPERTLRKRAEADAAALDATLPEAV